MATFELTGPDGGTYHVDAPDEHAAIAAFSAFHGAKPAAAPAAPAPDKYQQAAIDERKAAFPDQTENPGFLSGIGNAVTSDAGFTRRLVHGATLGADSTLMAAAMTPLEMFKRGINPKEAYNYAKAREDQIMGDARKNTGALGTAAEVLGGGVAGSGLANAGITAGRLLAPEAGILARSGASAADAAALGGFSGAMEGNGVGERFNNAIKGIAAGGAVGGLTPGALKLAGAALSPITSNIRARINPEGFGQSQIARAVSESGQAPQALGQQVADANAAGQPYTLADALGNPGQRMLSTVTRAPGEGRTQAVQFLEGRQAGQGDRVGDIVDEGLGAGNTARQTVDQLTETARRESAPFYQKALDNKPVWNDRIQQFLDDPVTNSGLKEGVAVQRLESLAAGKKFDPNDYAITHFNEAGDPVLGAVPNMRTINLIKKGWDNQLEAYRDSTTGKLMLDEKGRALDAVRRSFLKEVDAVNPDYGMARSLYAGPAQVRDAVTAGTKAATRGRATDNIARFNALTAPSQQGFRGGYADTLASKIESSRPGQNKIGPLSTPKAANELNAMSLHQGPVQPGALNPLQQRLAREQTMFETRNAALGGSKTADNLNDHAAMGISPHLVGNIIAGNWHGAVRNVLSAGHTMMTGNTPAVREAVGRALLDQGVTPAALQDAIGKTVQRIKFVQNIARNLGRGAAGGLAVAGPGQK